jgi:predicted MFS family arabinose efflux permease
MRGIAATDTPRWPMPSLLVMSATVFLSVTTELVPAGLLPAMSHDLHVTPGRLGLLVTAFAAVMAISAAPLGFATTRFPPRALLTATLLGYTASNVVMSVCSSYWVALGARLLGGLTHAVFWITIQSFAGRIVAPERVGRAITIVFAGGNLSILLGIPAGTALGQAIGWRATFGVLAGVSLALALAVWRILPEPGPAMAADSEPVRPAHVVRTPGLLILIGVTAATVLGHFSFSTYVVPFLLHVGVTTAAIPSALLCFGIGGAVGAVLAGVYADRRLRPATVTAAALLVAAYGLLTATAVVGGAAPAVAVAGLVVAGMVMGSAPALWQTRLMRITPHGTEAATALNASAFNIGIGGGALLGGVVIDQWGPAALPAIAVALTAVGLTLRVLGDRARSLSPSGLAGRSPAQPSGDGSADDRGHREVAAGGDPHGRVRVRVDDDRAQLAGGQHIQ